ncbi:sulfatase-like hydrolase/transferase [Paenibacillus sp. HB172176]|uniref:sulfatase family protein n=1 Tax=Paenibacillus sp. HB172176 TaxID=2493690 RepID=UPI0014388EA3|nr:sulfatase-like hydrolase/transferase [Paenibacillus sp. HB172176]
MKPNIIFITADQLAAATLHSYGGSVPSSPVLDSLAAGGARFDRCYAHVPVCAPNRATFLTGRSMSIHGVTTNNLVLPQDVPTYAQVLRSNGYRTGGFGKFHQTPMQQPLPATLKHLGFDEAVLTEDTKLGPWLDWIGEYHPEYYDKALATCWPMPYLDHYGEDGIDLRERWKHAFETFVAPLRKSSDWAPMYASPLPKELHQTTFIAEQGLDFMSRHVTQYPDQPFFCHISFVDPHNPYDPPAPYDAMFRSEDMPLPVKRAEGEREIPALTRAREMMDFRRVSQSDPVLKQLQAYFHGSVRFIDDQIGRVVAWLREKELDSNTIIVFTTDHGEMLGDHGFITKGAMHYDKSIRCPLIVHGPGIEGGGVSDRLVSSLDFFPTFCDWAGITEVPPNEGVSFAEACAGRHHAMTEARDLSIQYGAVRTLVTDTGWRLTLYNEEDRIYGQMFHLTEDPDEQINLYDKDEWQTQKLELLERLAMIHAREGGVQQFRNLPIHEGYRCLVDEFELKPIIRN